MRRAIWLGTAIWLMAARATGGDLRFRTHEDAWVQPAIEEGRRSSPTFRALLDSIDRSDVVVYVRTLNPLADPRAAFVSFVSSAGGRRYLILSVSARLHGGLLTALLGHELQHVWEIASHRAIRDAASLERFYRANGIDRGFDGRTRGFDSQAAVDAGSRVFHELGESRAAVAATRP